MTNFEQKYKDQLITLCINQDWRRVLSLCESTMRRLEESGDYPEKQADKLLRGRIIDITFYQQKIT